MGKGKGYIKKQTKAVRERKVKSDNHTYAHA